jgi:hypothetical protein
MYGSTNTTIAVVSFEFNPRRFRGSIDIPFITTRDPS